MYFELIQFTSNESRFGVVLITYVSVCVRVRVCLCSCVFGDLIYMINLINQFNQWESRTVVILKSEELSQYLFDSESPTQYYQFYFAKCPQCSRWKGKFYSLFIIFNQELPLSEETILEWSQLENECCDNFFKQIFRKNVFTFQHSNVHLIWLIHWHDNMDLL